MYVKTRNWRDENRVFEALNVSYIKLTNFIDL